MKPNIQSRTVFLGDNLDFLRGINSECVDLIYADPPFNKKKEFTAPIGSQAEGAGFLDLFAEEDIKDEWVDAFRHENFELHSYLSGIKAIGNSYNYCYLVYMAIRILECHRVLKRSGSFYLHCDQTMSHYLKLLLDCIFSEKNFRGDIIWKSAPNKNDARKRKFGNRTNNVFHYTKGDKFTFNTLFDPLSDEHVSKSYRYRDKRGRYMTAPLYSNTALGGYGKQKPFTFNGLNKRWFNTLETLQKFDAEDRLHISKSGGVRKKVYLSESKGTPKSNLWEDINFVQGDEGVGWPTQKPLALMERIITASSHPGDWVLDPFCGCVTTCIAAEILGREWVGIDVAKEAWNQIECRLKKEVPADMFRGEPHFSTTPPKRGKSDARPKKYVYVISNPAYPGMYKVGVAANAESRLNQFQTADPKRRYQLEYKILTPEYKTLDPYIHREFDGDHEWVPGELDAIIDAIKRYRPAQNDLVGHNAGRYE